MVKKILFEMVWVLVMTTAMTVFVSGQNLKSSLTANSTIKTKQVIEKPDNKQAVIEYSEGTSVTVKLDALKTKGSARITRTADGTFINLEVSGLPNNAKDYYVYTVDESGTISLLDEITIEKGQNKSSLKTPLSKFMLMLSPKSDLTSSGDSSASFFRSRISAGYTAEIPD